MVTFNNGMNDLNGLIKMNNKNALLRYNQADNGLKINAQMTTNTMTMRKKAVLSCPVLMVVNSMSWISQISSFFDFCGAYSLIIKVKTGFSNSV